jgi:hypothetical protein
MSYKDVTFCPFYLECIYGETCKVALTPKVEDTAKEWWGKDNPPISVYLDKPNCFKEKNMKIKYKFNKE